MTLIKSISGIRGTIGGQAGEGLNPLDIVKFTSAYATLIRKTCTVKSNKIVVGRDARISGEMVKNVVVGTLMGMGFDVVNIGLASTPTTELAVTMEGACGGIILTASHNPRQWNALKLLNENGEFLNAEEGQEVLRIAAAEEFDFADIDLKFYDDFVAWFTAKNYSVNTIGRHVKELKIIMRAAREEGLHDNGLIESRKFRVLTADVENIYLTESEIRAIANLDLSDNKHKDIARDVFLVGCYTAQRFSDYSTINEGNIRTLESGQLVIDLKQQKTGNHVIIPVRPELQAILDKYENRLPKSYEQKVNKFIKEIAREAGITEKIEVSYVENGERKTHLVEKCDLVKTHTARRSGATNMYLAGIPTIAIMKITGHKTEKEFMKYIKITEEQTAMELMNHPYFSGR